MSIIVVGQSCYDVNIQLDQMVEENKKYRIEKDPFECIGGPAFNAACVLGKWKEEVYLVSPIGKDNYGSIIKDYANKVGIHLDCIIEPAQWSTPHSQIYIHDGNRTIFNFVKPLGHIDYQYPLNKCDFILTDGHLADITLNLFQQFPNAITIMDAGGVRKERIEVAKRVDYLITSKQFAQEYTGKEISEENYKEIFESVEKINNKTAVITLGEDGLLYRTKGEIKRMRAYLTSSVDSTGAGDIFHGAFVYCLANGFDFEEALRFSSMTSSISTEKMGSSVAIPSLNEVTIRLKEKA